MNDGRFGDALVPKLDNSLRIVALNVDTIPAPAWGKKRRDLVEWWTRDAVDVACLSEMGRHWPSLSDEDR